ncbi:MAG TPA: ATP-binding protein [Polyangiaceae bacterium]|nr:ATP-binding protein [Polyangiaceae bacterium]
MKSEPESMSASESQLAFRIRVALEECQSVALAVIASGGTITNWNKGCERLFGYAAQEAVGRQFGDFADDAEAVALLPGRVSRSNAIETEVRMRHKDGHVIDVVLAAGVAWDAHGPVEKVAMFIQDVTLTKTTRNRLHAAKQVEQMANAAAGLAHDINSVLTIVSSYARFVAEAPLTTTQQEDLAVAVEAASRASVLASQLLGLYGKRSPRATTVDLNDAVESIAQIVRRMLNGSITVTTRLPTASMKVRAATEQVDRILLNLLTNARDAMPRGGIASISLRSVEVAPGHELHGQIRDGSYAVIVVKDTGIGMDASVRSRIFEPSFTTKADGEGTGLGLSVVQEIVRDLRGGLQVESEPRWGAAFSVYLPLLSEGSTDASDVVLAADDLAYRQKQAARQLRPSVLVVDEDAALCESLVHLLMQQDIDATSAVGVASALQILRTRAIDVLITEQSLGGADGLQLLETTQETFPEIAKILLTREASPDVAVAAVNKGRVVRILLKSMQPSAICDEIVRVAREARSLGGRA